MNILDTIVAHKHTEVAATKAQVSQNTLENSALFSRQPLSISDFMRRDDRCGVIAEIKRQSPSKGVINADVAVADLAQGYDKAGASAISVLTDTQFFGGTADDLLTARPVCHCPILRKDFMIDEYQVLEAKAWGADVILLIAAVLNKTQIETLGGLAQSLGMEVLLEVHNEEELNNSITDKVNLIGVNNRDLKTFVTDVQTSYDLVDKIPNDFIKVSESGITNVAVIKGLREQGYQGFLIGENFMKNANPAQAAQEFMSQLL